MAAVRLLQIMAREAVQPLLALLPARAAVVVWQVAGLLLRVGLVLAVMQILRAAAELLGIQRVFQVITLTVAPVGHQRLAATERVVATRKRVISLQQIAAVAVAVRVLRFQRHLAAVAVLAVMLKN